MPHNEHIHIVYVKRIQCAAEKSPVSLKKKEKKKGAVLRVLVSEEVGSSLSICMRNS